jgi:hypothetical protein
MSSSQPPTQSTRERRLARALDAIERAGNRLPDPALLFLILLGLVALLSAWLSTRSFAAIDPRTGAPLVVQNLLAPANLTAFLGQLVKTFTDFPPLGVVLVAMLGIGVAEHTGFINAALSRLLALTRPALLTPMVIVVGIVSHVAVDAGYVLVVPLGGLIFLAAGRHPLAGIAAAFAGVSGGFSANFVPSSLDPLLTGISQAAAQLIDPAITLNPLSGSRAGPHRRHHPRARRGDGARQYPRRSPLGRRPGVSRPATRSLGGPQRRRLRGRAAGHARGGCGRCGAAVLVARSALHAAGLCRDRSRPRRLPAGLGLVASRRGFLGIAPAVAPRAGGRPGRRHAEWRGAGS